MEQFSSNPFLKKVISLDDIFTPENFTEEHRMIASTASAYVEQEVLPVLPEIEKQQFDQSIELLRKAGELGLLGSDVPEEYGGLDLDKISSVIIMEEIGKTRSFSTTFGGQIGIGSLPIVYYGTDEQKEKYLPYVVSGEKIGAYALTEPSAGTDALSIKTTARLSDDGKYYLINGEKQFITNASFADFFILYAKVDGEKFTAFIVDKNSEGITIGPEEKKMGLKGSSTTPVILEDVKVPVENVLGEIGRGHLIAFNILNNGRHKISAASLGMAKRALELAVQHVTERKQFNRPLSQFPLIQEKIADIAAKIFTIESMVYRSAGELDRGYQYCKENNIPYRDILKQFAVEASINKVFASEALDIIVDEVLQMHGGYGYISEYEVEHLYRDSRINRIFEGTNEINRMIIAQTLLQSKAEWPDFRKLDEGPSEEMAQEWELLSNLRRLAGQAMEMILQSFENYKEEQEILAWLANLAISIYAIESNLFRVEKLLANKAQKKIKEKKLLAKIFAYEASSKIVSEMFKFSVLHDEQIKQQKEKLFKTIQSSNNDFVHDKRLIASAVITAGNYSGIHKL